MHFSHGNENRYLKLSECFGFPEEESIVKLCIKLYNTDHFHFDKCCRRYIPNTGFEFCIVFFISEICNFEYNCEYNIFRKENLIFNFNIYFGDHNLPYYKVKMWTRGESLPSHFLPEKKSIKQNLKSEIEIYRN